MAQIINAIGSISARSISSPFLEPTEFVGNSLNSFYSEFLIYCFFKPFKIPEHLTSNHASQQPSILVPYDCDKNFEPCNFLPNLHIIIS